MNETIKTRIDLRPVAVAFNHMTLYEDYSVLVNTALVSEWTINDDGHLRVHMSNGGSYELTPEQAEWFIERVNQAIELTRLQMDQRIVPVNGARGQ